MQLPINDFFSQTSIQLPVPLTKIYTRNKSNMGPEQTSKLLKQDMVFLSSPLLNGITVVFPRELFDVKEEAPARPLTVDAPLDSKAGAV